MTHAFLPLLLAANTSLAGPISVTPRTLEWKPAELDGVPMWLQEEWSKGSIVLPYLSGGDPLIAARINDALFLQLLGVPAPSEPGSKFRLPERTTPDSTEFIRFEVLRNDAQMVVFEILSGACGATCAESKVEYNFDARSGRQVETDDLFTRQGLSVVGRRMREEKIRQYSAESRRLGAEVRALRSKKNVDPEELSHLEDSLATNQYCFEQTRDERKERGASSEKGIDATRGFDLSLGGSQGVMFRVDAACGDLNERDSTVTLGSITLTIPPSDLPALLTPYGKALLLGEGEAPAPRNPFGQILHGKLGKRAITAHLGRPEADGSLAGVYFYDKFRKPIALSGRWNGSQLELTETLSDGENAKLVLIRKGLGFAGTWSAKTKQLPAVLDW